MSIRLMEQMLEAFRGFTPEAVANNANLTLAKLLIRDLSTALNWQPALTAEVVARMKIEVDDAAYKEHTELFNDIAHEMVRILVLIYDEIRREFDVNTAIAYLREAAAQMHLTYG